MKADMILINLNAPHMLPLYDLPANLVYAAQASDVDTVLIDGRVVMEKRKITSFDEEEVLRQVKACALRLVQG